MKIVTQKLVTQKGKAGDEYTGPMIVDMKNRTIFIEPSYDYCWYSVYAGVAELDALSDNEWHYDRLVRLGIYGEYRKAEEVVYEIASAVDNEHNVFYMPEDDSGADDEE